MTIASPSAAHRWPRLVPGTVVAVVLALLATLAVTSVGFPVRKLDLNDSGIWVTNDAEALFGRLNKSAGTLDGLLSPAGGVSTSLDLDMLQDGFHLVAREGASGRLTPVDPATVTHATDRAVTIDPTFRVDLRGGTLAVLDPRSGNLWATRYDGDGLVDLAEVDTTGEPRASVGAPAPGASGGMEADLAVGVDGTVHASSTGGRSVALVAAGRGFAEPAYRDGPKLTSVQVTGVGAKVAVLDAAGGTLWDLDGKKHDIGADVLARLQLPGAASDDVRVATAKGLLAVSDAGVRTLTAADGTPAVPATLAGCTFAAWAGSPGRIVRACGDGPAEDLPVDPESTLTNPVFRINHGQVILNDTSDGNIYSFEEARFIDEWDEVRPPTSSEVGRSRANSEPDPNRPPRANPDEQGVRPGRTTVVHPLDNDSDPGGRILAITEVTQPSGGASVAIAPDGQSLLYTLPEGAVGGSFDYTVTNGVQPAKATVTIRTRAAGDNARPELRPGYEVPQYALSSWGTLALSVAGDWRDPDGDPIAVTKAEVEGSQVGIGADGRLNVVAGRADETRVETIRYEVSDGGEPQQGTVQVKVLAHNATAGDAPLTQPDAVRGEVGKPVVVSPLRNDSPGADPLNPRAELALAGRLAAPDGLRVDTDTKTGQVVVTGSQPGTFFLDYQAKYGTTRFSPGRIRVDLGAPQPSARPVAVPDQVTVRGRNAGMVDVLANDSDPMGSVLTVLGAQVDGPPDSDPELQVAVLKGRWIRVAPTRDRLDPNPTVVTYQVSNGTSEPTTGTLLVTQIPAPDGDEVLVRDDQAVVRAGDSVLVPVLDNDSSASGAQLVLDTNTEGPTVGQLKVLDPEVAADAAQSDVGRAYVVNDQVRYVAPTGVTAPKQVKVQYQASVPGTTSQTGIVTITVNPEPGEANPNQAPAPQSIEARVTTGQTLEIPVVTSGQDPDGDTVTVLGIASAPRQGRVMGFSPRSITYQAFPDAGVGGTDSFTYVVTDRFGATETGLVRVAITPPGEVQPPVAVPDTMTARPGVDVQVFPMTNDLFDEADRPTIVPFDAESGVVPEGVRLDGERGPIVAKAPARDAAPVQVAYALANSGGAGPAASITVTAREGFLNPPRVYDQVARAEGATATVDVLAGAWDPDGPTSALRVTHLSNPGATAAGGLVAIPLLDRTQVVTFEVTDGDGATSAGVIYVPAAGTGVPFLKQGGLIRVDQNQSTAVVLADHVESSRGTPVRISVAESMGAAPLHVTVTPDSHDRFTVTASGDYAGPAAVFMEVMDGDADDPATRRAFVSIPVQVGPETPVLRCPESTTRVVQGGQPVRLKVSSVCSVWTPDPDAAATLPYSVEWAGDAPRDVAISAADGFVTINPGSNAVPGSKGTIRLGVAGSPALKQDLQVVVLPAARPRLVVGDIRDVRQGTAVSQTIQMSSPLRSPQYTIVDMVQTGGQPAAREFQGSRFTITPGGSSSGTMTFQVTASDLADRSRTDRFVTASLTVTVYGVPDTPAPPQPAQQLLSHSASVAYTAPNDNGAPILEYQVQGGGVTKSCGTATRCDITGLKNGVPVRFQVRARNKAGWSEWSAAGGSVTPDQVPGRVPSFSAGTPADGSLTLTWTPAPVDGTPVSEYIISYAGNRVVAGGSETSKVVRGLSNNSVYTFSIVAKNAAGLGQQSASATGQSSGRPVVPGSPKVAASDLGATAQVTVSWAAADPQGPRPVTYTVTRGGTQVYRGTDTSFGQTVAYDGTQHTYAVTATNATGGAAHTSAPVSTTWTATGKPGTWGAWTFKATGADGTIDAAWTVPPSRGSQSKVSLVLNGSARGMPSGTGSTTTPGSTSLTGLANGTTYSAHVRVCNENNACTQSSTLTAVPHGPLAQPTIRTWLVNDTTIAWETTANGNGRTATLAITGNLGTASTTGAGPMRLTGQKSIGWSTLGQVTATVSDPQRGSKSISDSQMTLEKPPPPPANPTVTVSRGSSAVGQPGCSAAWCAYVVVTTKDFSGNVSCSITSSDQGVFGSPMTVGPNATKQSGWYFGGFTITVACSGNGQSASGTNSNWKR